MSVLKTLSGVVRYIPVDGETAWGGQVTGILDDLIDQAENPSLVNPAGLALAEALANGSNKVTIKAPASVTADYTITLPAADGAANQFLKRDSSGNLVWTDSVTSTTLNDAYLNGRIITADAGEIQIDGAGGIRVNGPTTLNDLSSGDTEITGSLNLTSFPILDVKKYGATGDGSTDDTLAIQTAIEAAEALGGGTVLIPYGTYKIDQLFITKAGIKIVGAGPQNTILSKTTGTTGTYVINADLTSSVRPFDFGVKGISIQGNTATRLYGAFKLRHVWGGKLENIYVKGVSQVIYLDATYWSTFENWFIEHYTTGITGSSPEGGNSNTFINVNMFDGNADGTAMPLDTTWMNNCTFIQFCCGASASYKAATMKMIGSNGNTYISCRFETYRTTGDWMRIGSNNKFVGCLWTTSETPAAGKYAVVIEGSNNYFNDLPLQFYGKLLKLTSDSSRNNIYLDNTGCSVPPYVTDYGTDNLLHWGIKDSIIGNRDTWGYADNYGCIFTKATNFGDVTLDGLVKTASSDTGPHGVGNVYEFDTPTGNCLWKQSIGSIGSNLAYTFSIWAKSTSGDVNHEETIGIIFSEIPTDSTDYIIRDDKWTRIVLPTYWSNGPFTRYVGVKLGGSSSGVLLYGPQVVSNGALSGGIMPPVAPGNYRRYLKDSFNVYDFGATGDGSTDDTAAIQGAIDAVLGKGGSIFLPRGTYYINQGRLNYTSLNPIKIYGEGWSSKIVWNPATDTPAQTMGLLNIYGTGDADALHCVGVTIRDLKFDFGGSRAGPTNTYKRGINIFNSDNIVIENCYLKGALAECIGLGNYGSPTTPGNYANIINNYITDFVQDGINPNVFYAVISGNHFYKGVQGIEAGRDYCTITNNEFRDITVYGVGICSIDGFVVSNNRFNDCINSSSGLSSAVGSIYIAGQGSSAKSQNGVVSGNEIYNPTQHGFQAGISVVRGTSTSTPQFINIVGNTIKGPQQGIYIGALEYSKISDNLIYPESGTSSTGLAVDNTAYNNYNTVNGNFVPGSWTNKAIELAAPSSQHNVAFANRTSTDTEETISDLSLGSGAKRVTYGTAAPVSGTWAQGDVCWNTAPSPTGWRGWVCTTAGTSGTWKGFGAIEA